MVTQGDMPEVPGVAEEEGESEGQPLVEHDDEFEDQPCHDCDAQVGQLHEFGCESERCPFCGGQLASCDCAYDKLGINDQLIPGTPLYEKGLSPTQELEWKRILDSKGRIPHVNEPNMCHLCSQKRPNVFTVPDQEWEKFIPPDLQDKIICRSCYDELKSRMPQGWRRAPTAGLRVEVSPGVSVNPEPKPEPSTIARRSPVPESWRKMAERALGGTK